MGAAAELRLAWDGGHTDGDPGSGRIRIDTPNPRRARYVYVNARDSEDALLDQLVPSWQLGDVLAIERPGAETNRIVAWITGPISHGGSYYRVPVIVRSVYGNFAAHDECVLLHQPNATIEGEAAPRRIEARPMARLGAARAVQPMAPLAPPIIDKAGAEDVTPEPAPSLAACSTCPSLEAEVKRLRAENAELLGILEELATDRREVYVAEA